MIPPPVLAYDEPAVEGLEVDRRDGRLTIVLPASDLRARAKDGVGMATAGFVYPVAIIVVGVFVAWAVVGTSPVPVLVSLAALCAVLYAILYPIVVVLGGVYNQTVWVEVLPEVVRLTAVGRGMNLTSAWSRSDIASVDVTMNGVRLRLRNSRRPGWIAFGNREQQLRICRLLRDELGIADATP